jgi:ribosomal protein L9
VLRLADAQTHPLHSVSEQDVVDAVAKQTTKVLEKKNITMPDVKLTGTYDISVKLHKEV